MVKKLAGQYMLPDNGSINVAKESKTCTICKIEKKIDDFAVDKKRKDGRRSECRWCQRVKARAYRRGYYERNRDLILGKYHAEKKINKNGKRA